MPWLRSMTKNPRYKKILVFEQIHLNVVYVSFSYFSRAKLIVHTLPGVGCKRLEFRFLNCPKNGVVKQIKRIGFAMDRLREMRMICASEHHSRTHASHSRASGMN